MTKINHSYPKDYCIFCSEKTNNNYRDEYFCDQDYHLYMIGNDFLFIRDIVNNFYIDYRKPLLKLYYRDLISNEKINMLEIQCYDIPLIKTKEDFLNFVLLA